MSRKSLKSFIQDELCDMSIKFTDPLRKNQPQRLSLKASRDVVISQAEDRNNCTSDIKTLFEAAKILRKSILKHQKWKFKGSVGAEKQHDIVPVQLALLLKWCIGGRSQFNAGNVECEYVAKKAFVIGQTIMYECLSDRHRLITKMCRGLIGTLENFLYRQQLL